nr:hypothetical protein [uncultured Pseudomonas sp.]
MSDCYRYGAFSKRFVLLVNVLFFMFFALPHSYADEAIEPSAQSMAREFLALRQIKGHFEGGVWNDAVDKWQGDKHRLLQQSLALMLRDAYSARQVRALLGEPDRIWPVSTAQYAQTLERTEWQGTPSGELWAYYWRGAHDQLVIALDGGRVVAGGWLMAGE